MDNQKMGRNILVREAPLELNEHQVHHEENGQTNRLPPYDNGSKTKQMMIWAFTFSSLLSIAGFAIGIYSQINGFNGLDCKESDNAQTGSPTQYCSTWSVPSSNVSKALTLLFTFVVTLSTEPLGYIHSVTLRWALAAEGKLSFNSSIRLFSASHQNWANGRITNIFYAIFLAMCYTGAACSLIEIAGNTDNALLNVFQDNFHTQIYAPGIITGSLGLFGLCSITGLGWLTGEWKRQIKSWNAHPLNTALVCLHHQKLFRNPGRSTLDAASRHNPSLSGGYLSTIQPSAIQTATRIRHIIRYWKGTSQFMIGSAFISLFVLLGVRLNYVGNSQFRWLFFPEYVDTSHQNWTNLLFIDLNGRVNSTGFLQFWPLLWIFFWQSYTIMAFHVTEFVVLLLRDEASWRKAAGAHCEGARLNQNALVAAVKDKSYITLFVLKPTCQWLLSLGIFFTIAGAFGINSLPLFVLILPIGLLTLATMFTSRHQPKGPQPSTYGHLQTIVDLVDDWGQGADGRLWWGDKGEIFVDGQSCRCIGTSGNVENIGAIELNKVYSNNL